VRWFPSSSNAKAHEQSCPDKDKDGQQVIVLGCAWYPEQWPESRWPEDLELMRQAGINMVRIAEFAWSRLEPAEGQFDFGWLERAVKLASDYDMSIVLGTPTAAPPAWLTQRYPETLAIREDGQQATHGIRCHYSPTSAVYRRFCARIADEMAKRFGHNEKVIGWQIDNEYHSVSYDQETRKQFQEWLHARFGTLENLANCWSTAYWSQDYSDWSQIPLPVSNHNPGLYLAFRQFISHVYAEFQCVQIDAIHQRAEPRQWITHNFMKWNDSYDHYELSADLDMVSWDNYVPTGHLDYIENGAMHDLVRGYKRKNFWLLETQPGQVNWGSINTTLDRGEVRAMAWHAIGHGADAVSYWQWRSALGGQEQMHGTLVGADGKPRPIYQEIAQLGQDLGKVSPYLTGTTIKTSIALLHSFDDRWAIDYQRHHEEFDPIAHLLNYYSPLRALGQTLDIVHPRVPLADYKLVIGPNLNILEAETAGHLLTYVNKGGHLVLGARSGMKDAFNALLPSRQPGPLAQSLGAHVEEYYALAEPVPIAGELGNGTASIWAEYLQTDAPDCEVLLRYEPCNGWLDGQPAMVTRLVGQGRITYIGAWLDAALMQKVANWLLEVSAVPTYWDQLPAGVELCPRVSADKQTFVLINHMPEPQSVTLPEAFFDILTGQTHEGTLQMPPQGIAVLQTQVALSPL
jgi:beta-galactosidase